MKKYSITTFEDFRKFTVVVNHEVFCTECGTKLTPTLFGYVWSCDCVAGQSVANNLTLV